jgi:hypothetical protein
MPVSWPAAHVGYDEHHKLRGRYGTLLTWYYLASSGDLDTVA